MRKRLFSSFVALVAATCFGGLPSAYQQVEWIASSGAQYIDTGVSPGADYGFSVSFNSGATESQKAIFGGKWQGNSWVLYKDNAALKWYGSGQSLGAIAAGQDYTVTMTPTNNNNGVFVLEREGFPSVTNTCPISYGGNPATVKVFGTGDANRYASIRLYRLTFMRKSGDTMTVENDFVPCYDKATGAAGLYDVKTGVFHGNAGSGTLVSGRAVGEGNALDVSAGAGGEVDLSVNGTYAEGSVVAIHATPAAGKVFARWIGDFEKVADVFSPDTEITVSGGASVTALFGNALYVGAEAGDFATVDAAVEAAQDGDTIFVRDGDYPRLTNKLLVVAKAVQIAAVNPGAAAICGNGNSASEARGLTLDHSLASVRGLVFKDMKCNNGDDTTALKLLNGLVENCVFTNVFVNNSNKLIMRVAGGLLRDTLFCDSTATGGSSGGMLQTGGAVTGCTFRNVAGETYAVRVDGWSAEFTDNTVTGCRGTKGTGTVALNAGLVADCNITNCTAFTAGGVSVTGGLLRDCVISGNSADAMSLYGGVKITAGEIDGCTIYGNTALNPVGSSLMAAGGTVRNTLAAESLTAIPSADIVRVEDGVIVENCIFQAPPSDGATLFNPTTFDERTLSVIEHVPAGECRVLADKVIGLAPLTVSFEADCPGASEWSWNFAGKGTSAEEKPQFTFTETGLQTVTLTAGSRSATLDIDVRAPVAYAAVGGGDVYPYDTPEKAATDIQAALDAVYADDETHGTVYVAAGDYVYSSPDVSASYSPFVVVRRNVTLRGPAEGTATIDVSKKSQNLYLYHPKAVVEGLRFANGRLNMNGPQYGANLNQFDGLVTNCVFTGGNANYAGNASIRGGRVTGSVFSKGTLSISGTDRMSGGLNVMGDSLIDNCLFEDNNGGYGAGLFVNASGAVVSNCVIRGSTGGNCGGAGLTILSGLVTCCVITNNASTTAAGGAYLKGGILRNSIIAFNKAKGTGAIRSNTAGGGGVFLEGGTVQNCTIAKNISASSTKSDGLVLLSGTIVNSIVAENSDADLGADEVYRTGGTATYCRFPVALAGEGNITADAMLCSAAAGDFTLLFGSPCIDGGTAVAGVEADIAGTARPQGAACDMGAYEMDFSGRLVASFESDVATGAGSVTAHLTAHVAGGTAPYTYLWSLDDFQVETDEPSYSYEFSCGSHDISLTVRDSSNPPQTSATVTRYGVVLVKTPVAYVSENGTGVWPYDTWEKATSNWNAIASAVCFDDETPARVYVADGTYMATDTDTYTLNITIPLEFIGTNAECKAVFDGLGKEHKVVNVANPRAVVKNIKIYNTKGGYGPNCAALEISAGLVTNCVFEKSSANGASLVLVSGGLVCDSVFSNGNGGEHTGGDRYGGGVYMTGGTVEGCLVEGCVNGAGGAARLNGAAAVMRGCVIRNNKTPSGGAVLVSKGLLEGCVITNNTGYGNSGSVVTVAAGGGVFATGAESTVRNCLIADNKTSKNAAASCGALYVEKSALAYNNHVILNTDTAGTVNDVYLTGGTVANTVAGTLASTAGETDCNFIGGDPKFRHPQTGDYTFTTASPCVNAGNSGYWLGIADPVDLLGRPRIRNLSVDIGCYECQSSGTIMTFR